MPTPPDPAVLYPDIAAHGSLAVALRSEGAGCLETVSVAPSDSAPLLHATVMSTLPHRGWLEISARRHERLWSIWGTDSFQNMPLVDGCTNDLAEVARAARAWHDGVALDDIHRAAPFAHPTGRFEVPDRDPVLLTESEWQGKRQEADELEYPWAKTHQSLIESAYAQPTLRALYPFTSHWALRFSTTTRPRLTVVGPWLAAHSDGTYGVGRNATGADLGRFATASEAVTLAVRHMSADLAPIALGG
ncbi:DUF6193 family natural product biosynthesis protein [Streptomyces sp. NPDC086080]|uniref:DUF6193 family natural product biosynthesis protein n=1 Tax=Streptomyces sp. NPDC086080 TaxID=3365748 RepID=UPI0037D87D99